MKPCVGPGLAILVLAAAMTAMPAAHAQAPSEVTVNVFPGGFNWGLYVAQDKGLFEKNGIRVTLQATPGSVAQMTGLSEGKFDIAMTAVDNIVAYVEGQGEAPIGPQPEFFAFLGSDTGFLSLVTAPDIKSIAELKGRTLSVDALTTGYAFVLFDILRRNGVNDGDYAVAKVGGMVQRWTALRERKQDGTMLSTPYNILARAEGFTQIAQATKVIGHYQGNVAAARRAYGRWHRSFVYLSQLMGWKHRHPRPAEFDAIAADGRAVAGTPEAVAEYVQEQMRAAGANYFVGQFAFGDLTQEETLRSIALFSREVMPRLAH